MDGLNQEFKNDPLGFIQKYHISQSGNLPQDSGVFEFDFQNNSAKTHVANSVEFHDFTQRGKDASLFSNRIRAYWLPWQASRTTSIQLGGNANYFFTSGLTGCRIVIAPPNDAENARVNPYVLHIAGNEEQDTGAFNAGSLWRDEQQNNFFTGDNTVDQGRLRSFSSTVSPEHGGYKGRCDITVTGFTTTNPNTNAREWQFWAQEPMVGEDREVWQVYT